MRLKLAAVVLSALGLGVPVLQAGPASASLIPTDVKVKKTASPNPVAPGGVLTYTINVQNTCSGAHPGGCTTGTDVITLTDVLPANTTFLSVLGQFPYDSNGNYPGPLCNTPAVGSTGTVTCIGALGDTATNGPHPGDSFTQFFVKVQVSPAATPGTSIGNAAQISLNNDPDQSNNVSAVGVTVGPPSANLSITKTAFPNPVTAGQNAGYTVTADNAGPSDAQNVTISDTLPANTTFVALVNPAGFTCTSPPVGGTGTIICTSPTLAVSDPPSVLQVGVKVDPGFTGPTLSNTATISSATPDPDTSNNSATATSPVVTRADLVTTKTCPTGPVAPDQTVACTVTVTNNGPSDAQAVSVTDNPPDNVDTIVLTPGPGVTCGPAGDPFTCNLGTVTVGQSKTIGFTARVSDSTQPGSSFTNTATATSATTDPNSSNNTADATTTVVACTITGTAGPDIIMATKGNQVICGLGGDDFIVAKGTNNVILGGTGDDIITGGSGNDIIVGGAGDDTLNGGGGTDQLFGDAGNDTLNAQDGAGGDVVNGGPGTADTCSADPGDTVTGCEL